MYVRTSKQRGLYEPESLLSERARSLLKRSWADQFARRVLPLLLKREDDLAPLYDAEMGRGNWSAARMMGLCILREMLGLRSDQETVDNLTFDARYQHALGLEPDSAVLSRRSLTDFRGRLAKHDTNSELTRRVFDEIARAAVDDMGLSTKTQRCDSTFIMSNISVRGRVALLSEALERLLTALEVAGLLEGVSAQARESVASDGWEARRSFTQVAKSLYEVLQQFESEPTVCVLPEYVLAAQVFGQHVKVRRAEASTLLLDATEEDDDGPGDDSPRRPGTSKKRPSAKQKARAAAKAKRKARRVTRQRGQVEGTEPNDDSADTDGQSAAQPAPDESAPQTQESNDEVTFEASTEGGVERIQSLHDPDARLGHKGTGYHAQITETSGNEGKPEILTSIDVVAANTSDMSCLESILSALTSKNMQPDDLLVDAGYSSGDNLVYAETMGVNLRGPARTPTRRTELTRDHFVFDDEGNVIECPAGHAPTRQTLQHSSMHKDPQPHAFFDRERCDACPHRQQCPVGDRSQKKETRLCITRGLRLRDKRLAEQQTPDFKDAYRMRAGIEASNSELKRAHDFDRLTVRGMSKVRNRALFKGAGCNIKRWTRYVTQQVTANEATKAA